MIGRTAASALQRVNAGEVAQEEGAKAGWRGRDGQQERKEDAEVEEEQELGDRGNTMEIKPAKHVRWLM